MRPTISNTPTDLRQKRVLPHSKVRGLIVRRAGPGDRGLDQAGVGAGDRRTSRGRRDVRFESAVTDYLFFQRRDCRMLEAQISGNGFPMQPGHDCCTDFNFLNELREKRDVRIAAMSGGGKFCLRKKSHATAVEEAFAGDLGALARLNAKLAGPIARFCVEPQKETVANIENDFFLRWFCQRRSDP